jgi:hypothetical protein
VSGAGLDAGEQQPGNGQDTSQDDEPRLVSRGLV